MSGRGRGRGGGGGGGARGGGGRGGSGRGGGRGNAPSVAPMMPSVASTSSSPSSLSGDLQNLALNVPAVAQVPTSTPVQPAQPPPPMQPSQTVVQVAPASSKSLRPPTRPQFGTIGKKVTVRANHFRVEFPDVNIHHYDVDINPEVKSKKVCRDILNNLVNLYRESHLGKRRLAYDGKKSVFTAGALPFESKEFVVKLVENDGGPRREREFKVSIKFAAKPDIDHLRQFLSGRQHNMPQETIQALDVVLRAGPSMSIDTEVVGRSFFSIKFGQASLENGLEYWKGFYQSLRPTQMGLSLNIDMSARAFYEPILVSDYVANNFRRDPSRPFSDQDRVKIKRALKGVKVEVCHGEYVRRYRIASLSTQPIHALTFTDQTGATLSVVQYFREKYNITLRQLMLPAIQVCRFLRGQRYLKKLNERQVSNLLRATCTRPADREGIIHNMVRNNNYNRDEFVKEFGIQVRAEMTSVEARILPPPPLKYHDTGKERLVNPQVGAWNMINKKMINGGKVDCWACINFSRLNYDQVDRFCYELGTMCTSKGMVFNPKPVIPHSQNHAGNIERALIDIHTKCLAQLKATGKQLELLIVILPDMSGHYGKIKRVCETELGIVSQCCQPKNVTKLSKQYFENVSLKINVKVGGRNTVLLHAIERKIPYLTDRPTIIFGADVTHPQPGEDSSPSIAAVVASMDWPEVTKYRGLVSAQPHRQEIIEDLYKTHQDPVKGVVHSGMIREHLMAFYKSTGQKPDRILFYRDGVSEGQFNQVLLEEIDKIRKACVSLQDNYLPRVTFVVVQKRHHTRLFPANHQDRSATDRSGNIIAGTVVDTSICHPTEFDFYLCSHAGIQGTSRPAHYHVLYDENKFNADALQMLTNSLCYTYARCTRSVSIVPPAYYAHLAAFRARYYVEGDISETDSSTAGAATRANVVAVRPLPSIIDKVKDVMFFC